MQVTLVISDDDMRNMYDQLEWEKKNQQNY